jgi:hypothetical protein
MKGIAPDAIPFPVSAIFMLAMSSFAYSRTVMLSSAGVNFSVLLRKILQSV